MEEINRDNYREFDAINYSKLSALSDYPAKVNEDRSFSENGNVLDLFCYEGEQAVHDEYHVSSLSSLPSEDMMNIVDLAPNYEDATLIQTAREYGYGADSWKDSTILRHIEEKAGDYILDLENAGDKKIIDWEMFTEMQRASKLLKSHEFTRDFFTAEWDFQVPVLTEVDIEGEPTKFKGLLDGMKEDEDVVIIHDLKFSSISLKSFPSQFMSWNYYLQAGQYTDIIKRETGKTTLFYNVVYSSVNKRVQKYIVSPDMIQVGIYGGIGYTGRKVKGYRELAKELLWHQKYNKWEYPYEVYQNDGVGTVDFQGEVLDS